jgi:hypothetical protein
MVERDWMPGSYYVDHVNHAMRTNHLSLMKKMTTIILLIVISFFSMGALAASSQVAKAAGPIDNFFCGFTGGIGLNTRAKTFDGGVLNSSQKTDGTAKMSIMDLYAPSLNWTTYNGTPRPDKIPVDKGNIFNLPSGYYDSDQTSSIVDNSDKSRSAVKCVGSSVLTMLGGTLLGLANGIANISAFFVSKAVDPDFICQDAQNTAGASCINLLAVIGGTGVAGDDGGIIGRLYSGLYQGLIVLVWMGVGIWIAWTGLAKRKLTAALGGLFSAFIIFAAGVIFLNNPLLVAEAPMRIGTTLGGCVVQGINGVNCMDSSSSDPNAAPSAGTECFVDDSATPDVSRALNLIARQSTCKIWKAFVLEPWSVGQFGYGYDALYYNQDGKTGVIFQNEYTKGALEKVWGDTRNNIGISLYSSDSNAMNTCKNESSKYLYKNLALYQLSLQSTLHTCNGSVDTKYHSTRMVNYGADSQTYGDWYWMVLTMNSTNASAGKGTGDISAMWRNWTGDNAFSRIGIGFIALIASGGGALTLVTTSVLAIMYLFVSVLLTAFAPLFFLIGIIPGQGKKIFLGYLQKVVSAILKYFACVLWMMVTVELYDAVLSNSQGLGGTLIFVIIVTMAMFMYRKEFLGMIGKANFGGTEFSNKIGKWTTDKMKGAGRFMALKEAGRAAGFVAGGDNMESYKGKGAGGKIKTLGHNFVQRTRSGSNQAGATAMRQLKRGNGVVANAAKSYDKIMGDRRKETRRKADHAATKLRKTSDAIRNRNINIATDRDMKEWDKSHKGATAAERQAQEQKVRKKYTNNLTAAKRDAKDIEAKRVKDLGGYEMVTKVENGVPVMKRNADGTLQLDANGQPQAVKVQSNRTNTEVHLEHLNELKELADNHHKSLETIATTKTKEGGIYAPAHNVAEQLGVTNSAEFAHDLDSYRNDMELVNAYAGRNLNDEQQQAVSEAQSRLATNSVSLAINKSDNEFIHKNAGGKSVNGVNTVADLNNEITDTSQKIMDANTERDNSLSMNREIDAVQTLDRQVQIAEKNADRMNRRRDSGSVHAGRARKTNDLNDMADSIMDDHGNYDEEILIDQMNRFRGQHHRVFNRGRNAPTIE